jgi:hypothetical protein
VVGDDSDAEKGACAMKWVIVLAMVVNGELSFSEAHDYPTEQACRDALSRVLDKYVEDGRDLRKMYGDCYMKSQSSN